MNTLPPLPVAVPLAVAALFMATSSVLPRRARDTLAIATALGVAVVCGFLLAESLGGPVVYWFGGWKPREGIALGISFVIDPMGAGLVRAVWVGLGVLTALVGGVMCFGERHLKRLLAFSSVSHTGMFLVGAALLAPEGLAGTALYVVGHGLVKGALFLAAGILLNRFASVDENFLHGKGRRFPGLGILFVVGGLALSGLPPFATWAGKSLIEEAGDHAGYGWLSPVLLVASALTGGAVLRAGGQIFLGVGAPQNEGAGTPTTEAKATDEDYDRPPWVMFLPVAALLALALAAGLWPGLGRGARAVAARLEDRRAYAAAVLGGPDTSAHVEPEKAGSRLPGVLYGLGAAGGALLLAALALFRRRLPTALCAVANRAGGPALRGLRALHSGNVADYVTWVVIGVAVVGGLFSLLFRG